jgi:uncharacterized membrane protein (UPF0127 family)
MIATSKKFDRFFLIVTVLGILLIGSAAKDQKFVRVYFPDGESLSAELAVTQEERALGLMFRKTIECDQGMLFVFDNEDFYSFWMKNMLIPLDLIWLDKEKRIVHIERCVPPCEREPCPSYSPRIPGMYVLELKAGSVEQRGLKIFDRLDFILPDL